MGILENNLGVLKFLTQVEDTLLKNPPFIIALLHNLLKATPVYKLVQTAREIEKKKPKDVAPVNK